VVVATGAEVTLEEAAPVPGLTCKVARSSSMRFWIVADWLETFCIWYEAVLISLRFFSQIAFCSSYPAIAVKSLSISASCAAILSLWSAMVDFWTPITTMAVMTASVTMQRIQFFGFKYHMGYAPMILG